MCLIPVLGISITVEERLSMIPKDEGESDWLAYRKLLTVLACAPTGWGLAPRA